MQYLTMYVCPTPTPIVSFVDSVWWTPSGQASGSQHQEGLVISDISEKDTGLYVCVSEENQIVSVFNLQISEIVGSRKSNLPRTRRQIIPPHTSNRIAEEKNQRVAQSDLALAVCLSIFFTFLIAFILGVLARPCVDVLWKRITTKKTPPPTNVVATVEQRQYDNMAFSSAEEAEQIGPRRERRVTFSTIDVGEDSSVNYYDTVASEDQNNMRTNAVIECETAGDAGSENGLQQSSPVDIQRDDSDSDGTTVRRNHNMEFEHIPDPAELEERTSMSSCSDSSLSEKESKGQMTRRDHTMPKSPQLAEDSFQQRAECSAATKGKVPKISTKGKSEIPGFSSEPFADWSPHTNNREPTDADISQDNEELFEFSDSPQSTSVSSSVLGSFNQSKQVVKPNSDKNIRGDISSSSSSINEDEPTRYAKKPAMRQDGSFSSDSSDSDDGREKSISDNLNSRLVTAEGETRKRIAPMPPPATYASSSSSDSEEENQEAGHNKGKRSQIKNRLNIRAPISQSDSFSSDESADKVKDYMKLQKKKKKKTTRIQESQPVNPNSNTQWPAVDLERSTRVKRHLDIKGSSLSSESSSTNDSEDETTVHKKDNERLHVSVTPVKVSQTGSHVPEIQWPAVDLGCSTRNKRHLDIKAPSPSSDSSSSSDSEDQTTGHTGNQRPGRLDIGRLPFQESITKSSDPDGTWPGVDLQHMSRVKRRLDIRAPSPSSDSSSSSDSEDETTVQKKENERLHVPIAPVKASQAGSHEPENQWPAVDLGRSTRVKRHLDIKAPSPSSDSSSSSDSEDQTTGHKKENERLHVPIAPVKVSQAGSHEPENQWPAVDLGRSTRVKRHLDIKAPSPSSDSSSSSDSEDQTTVQKKENERLHVSVTPVKAPQAGSHEPENQWPAVDLGRSTRVKRHLDIKAPSPSSDSSSSSDSEDQTTVQKKENERLHVSVTPVKAPQTGSHEPENPWPAVDLGRSTRVKRHLDIKAPSPSSDSSSSSDSEDQTTGHKKENERLHVPIAPVKVSQAGSHEPENQWPAVDLGRSTRVKRHLDIKAPSPSSDSSSSSDSEDQTTGHKKENERLHVPIAPVKVSQAGSHEPENQWPAVDLGRSTRVKRHLDIKAPSPSSDSSSSSDSEDQTTVQKKENERLHVSVTPVKAPQTGSHEPENQWPAVDLGRSTRVKRHLDIKAPSPSSDSSSSSDSEDQTTGHKKENERLHVPIAPVKVSQAGSHEPENQWPAVDLGRSTRVKRHLDIKAPSPSSDSSSSSDSEDQTTGHKKENERLHVPIAPVKVSQAGSHEPENQWPAVDLGRSTRVKRHLDIKAPSPSSDSSSSSDSEDQTTVQKKENERLHVSVTPVKAPQTGSHEPENQWPAVDLGRSTRVKRHLDIKAPSPSSDSSSSSDSEDQTTVQKKENERLHVSVTPVKAPQTGSHEPENPWPAVDLGRSTRVKRHLDIKAPSPSSDSSSSSDSEDQTTGHKKENERLHVPIAPVKVSQAGSHEPENQWPAVDLGRSTRVKRHLDIKAPSPSSDSSSSSDSEDQTTVQKKENERLHVSVTPVKAPQTGSHEPENPWPAVDLGRSTRVKRHLDIKAPSPSSDSSSSSDSEDQTTGHKKENERLHVPIAPVKVSQAGSHEPENQWPAVDLGRSTRVKRHLDIKAPSPSSDSSSSSDSEDQTTVHKKENARLHVPIAPVKVSQTESHEPENLWPAVDLGRSTRVKRHLDIKAPSPSSDSSSSSDNEDQTTGHKKENERLHVPIAPVKVSQAGSHEPENQWPAVDLGRSTRVKRRLDIKAPSPSSDSSSSSDSEDQTTGHTGNQRPGRLDIGRLPFQESKTKSSDPDGTWPGVDLQHIPRVKRRLDIKAPSPSSDSSSSSDSEDETTVQKKENERLHVSVAPVKAPQTVSHEPENQWPAVYFVHSTRVQRRLDIKAPSPSSGSSSSSDSEDQTTRHTRNQRPGRLDIGSLPFQESKTKSSDPDGTWPGVDLQHIPRIKRRLDIKAPSPSSDSSSSSDSEDETTVQKKENERLHVSVAPVKAPQTVSHEPENQWPAVYFVHSTRVQRRLDIKAPSPSSGSSSSSDSEDQTTRHTRNQRPGRLDIGSLPFQESKTKSSDPDGTWPGVDLQHIPRIKRRLDIRAPSPSSEKLLMSILSGGNTGHIQEGKIEKAYKSLSYSSSSSDNEEEGIKHFNNQPETSATDPNSKWPKVGFSSNLHIKRRLDIKAHLTSPESSSSSDESDVKTKDLPMTKRDRSHVGFIPQVNRRLDIKAPLLSSKSLDTQQSESHSSRSESEDENRDNKVEMGVTATLAASEKMFIKNPKVPGINISRSPKEDPVKLERYTVITDGNKPTPDTIPITPEINSELQIKWATMKLGVSRTRKRLEITSHAKEPPGLPSSSQPDSPYSSSSESGPSRKARLNRRVVGTHEIIHTDSSSILENKSVNVSATPKNLDKYSTSADAKDRVREDYNILVNEEKSKPDSMLVDFGPPPVRVTEKAPVTPSQQQPHSSSSSSSSEDETISHSVPDLSAGVPRIKRRLLIKAPSPQPSSSPSSCSENENDAIAYNSKQSIHSSYILGMADDYITPYKRSIIKASSVPSNSFTPSGRGQPVDFTEQRPTGVDMLTGKMHAPLEPMSSPRMTLDEMTERRIEQSRSYADVDLPREIRWAGVGRHLSDPLMSKPASVNSARRPLRQGPPAEPKSSALDPSSSVSIAEIMQGSGISGRTVVHKYSSLPATSVAPLSDDALNKVGNLPGRTHEMSGSVPEGNKARRGLGALKNMASERRTWEANVDKDASPSLDGHGPRDGNSFEQDIKVQKQVRLASGSVDEREAGYLLYGIPLYRRHNRDSKPPQEAPPPVPETPPPDY
ncbi:uncharacterized protein lrrc66 [Odontesthes bonariensis]